MMQQDCGEQKSGYYGTAILNYLASEEKKPFSFWAFLDFILIWFLPLGAGVAEGKRVIVFCFVR